MNEFEELAPSNMNYRVHRNVHFLRFNSFFWPNFQHQLYVHCRLDRKMGKVRYYYSNGCHFNFLSKSEGLVEIHVNIRS